MSKKHFFLITLFCFFGTYGKAQTDSTDLDFYATAPVLLTFEDSIMYDDINYKQLFVSFDFSDSLDVAKLWIDLIVAVDSTTQFLRSNYLFNKEQLILAGFYVGAVVTINLGSFEIDRMYQVAIRFEGYTGNELRLIAKHLEI